LGLKFNLMSGRKSYREIAFQKVVFGLGILPLRLHYEKYFNIGQKHLAPGNRVAEKEGFLFGRFQVIHGNLLGSKFNL
jgi:hypothetical protein